MMDYEVLYNRCTEKTGGSDKNMIMNDLDPVDDAGYINKEKTMWLWKSYDDWVDHVKSLTKEMSLIVKRNGEPKISTIADKKEFLLGGILFNSILTMDVCSRIRPTRVELWRTILRDDVIEAMMECGSALHEDDYSTEQLVMINDAGECGVIANIYPGSPTTKKIRVSKL